MNSTIAGGKNGDVDVNVIRDQEYHAYTSPVNSTDEDDGNNNNDDHAAAAAAYVEQQNPQLSATYTNNNNHHNNKPNHTRQPSMTIPLPLPLPPVEIPSSFVNTSLQRLVLVAAATAATLGYDVGIMAAAIQPMEETMDLGSIEKEIAMGSLNFVAALGALLGGRVANIQGRKYTVWLCCWIFIIGTLLMALAPGYYLFLLGRVVTGMGVGVSFVAAPVYLSEVAPTHLRGRLNTVFDVAINGGILLGYVLGFCVQLIPGLQNEWKWRIMLFLGIILPICVLFNLRHLPESPRWLVMVNRSNEAMEVLKQLTDNYSSVNDTNETGQYVPIVIDGMPIATTEAVQSPTNTSNKDHNHHHHLYKMISTMEDELREEQEERSSTPLTPLQTIMECKISKQMRLAMALGFWQQITGTEAVLYYSADFLQQAKLESPTQRLLGNCFVGLCKLTPELIAMQYVDTLGRRPLILTSAVSLVISIFLLSAAFYLEWSPLIVVIFLCSIMASFSIGIGPFSFLVASESLGLSERATGMTLCAATNRCTSGTVALTAVSMYEALGSSGLFAIYGLIGMASIPFYYMKIPETAGQSLEDLSARYSKKRRRGRQRRPEIELGGTDAIETDSIVTSETTAKAVEGTMA